MMKLDNLEEYGIETLFERLRKCFVWYEAESRFIFLDNLDRITKLRLYTTEEGYLLDSLFQYIPPPEIVLTPNGLVNYIPELPGLKLGYMYHSTIQSTLSLEPLRWVSYPPDISISLKHLNLKFQHWKPRHIQIDNWKFSSLNKRSVLGEIDDQMWLITPYKCIPIPRDSLLMSQVSYVKSQFYK